MQGDSIKAMSPSTTLVPVADYLRTSYKPACEYQNGVLIPKSMPTRKHSIVQLRIGQFILSQFPAYWAGTELTVRLSADRFLVPDVAVERHGRNEGLYPTEPVALCVEVMSPNDRMSEMTAKAEEYTAWGVPMVWIVDPERLAAWEFSEANGLREARGQLRAGDISIPLDALFAGL
jgi:Uma2 family endonuclease